MGPRDPYDRKVESPHFWGYLKRGPSLFWTLLPWSRQVLQFVQVSGRVGKEWLLMAFGSWWRDFKWKWIMGNSTVTEWHSDTLNHCINFTLVVKINLKLQLHHYTHYLHDTHFSFGKDFFVYEICILIGFLRNDGKMDKGFRPLHICVKFCEFSGGNWLKIYSM